MLKYLFILINTISLFFYSLFGGDGGITITNTIPTEIPPGHEVKVQVTVAKGSMSGFAKLQLELPAGISAREAESKGANFSFGDGIVKWVWASLPNDNELTVTLILITEPDASGKQIITGKYSYVDNNAKQVVDMPPVEVTISKDAVVKTETTTPAKTETTEIPTTTPVTTTESNKEPDGNINVQRKVVKGGATGEYIVMLKVVKGTTKGFARYSDDLPEGHTAESVKTEGASFSVADGKIKFVWVTVPEKDELELSYKISGATKPFILNGEYSYLEQNQSKKYLLPKEEINPGETADVVKNDVTPKVTETKTTTASETPTTAPTETKTETTTPKEDVVKTETKENTTQPVETLRKNDGSVNFMVQIGAFTNSEVTANRLAKKFNISEKIKSEMQGGFSKFMIGDHSEYKNARDHREKVRSGNGVNSAFVVAYNGPKRITVQEALMISNQKWFK